MNDQPTDEQVAESLLISFTTHPSNAVLTKAFKESIVTSLTTVRAEGEAKGIERAATVAKLEADKPRYRWEDLGAIIQEAIMALIFTRQPAKPVSPFGKDRNGRQCECFKECYNGTGHIRKKDPGCQYNLTNYDYCPDCGAPKRTDEVRA